MLNLLRGKFDTLKDFLDLGRQYHKDLDLKSDSFLWRDEQFVSTTTDLANPTAPPTTPIRCANLLGYHVLNRLSLMTTGGNLASKKLHGPPFQSQRLNLWRWCSIMAFTWLNVWLHHSRQLLLSTWSVSNMGTKPNKKLKGLKRCRLKIWRSTWAKKRSSMRPSTIGKDTE